MWNQGKSQKYPLPPPILDNETRLYLIAAKAIFGKTEAMAKKRRKTNEEETKPKAAREKSGMARTLWRGTISFGLINIPVRLYSAYKSESVHFHLIHKKDRSRIEQRVFCALEQKQIPKTELVKGYEISKDRHVIIEEKDLQKLAPKASRTIELIQFVEMKQIDPLFYDRPYYMLPEEAGTKAYTLLLEAMRKSGKAGIGKFVMHKKEYLAAIRTIDNALYVNTLHFSNEIIQAHEIQGAPAKASASDAEVKMAQQLVQTLTADFEPEKFHDDYRDAVLELVQNKVAGKEVFVAPGPEEPEAEVVDLMSALKASLNNIEKKPAKKKAA
jgi:DNA end-binding protein Ku